MPQSRLPQGGTNLFQQIKEVCTNAEAGGQKLYRLSIGQPTGPALMSARQAAADALLSGKQEMHEYQDNACLLCPDFASRFVQCHVKTDLSTLEIAYLPIPGIKPMLGLIPLACGVGTGCLAVLTTTKPGYPTPADWCRYFGKSSVFHTHIVLNRQNQFRFPPVILNANEDVKPDLVMMNYPHNPSGQVASRQWLEELCALAEKLNIRLFNDAAYAILAHDDEHCALTDVATNFPKLSWAEAFSASKAGNFTGWRVGAMVGSPDFIGDIAKIKGNTDSGFNAALAIGVLHAFEHDRQSIEAVRLIYENRLKNLIGTLLQCGMRLAVEPKAGFFTFWQRPSRAFGQNIESAEQFNFLMIERTGLVGVHFEPYIRYAVCGQDSECVEEIRSAFSAAQIAY